MKRLGVFSVLLALLVTACSGKLTVFSYTYRSKSINAKQFEALRAATLTGRKVEYLSKKVRPGCEVIDAEAGGGTSIGVCVSDGKVDVFGSYIEMDSTKIEPNFGGDRRNERAHQKHLSLKQAVEAYFEKLGTHLPTPELRNMEYSEILVEPSTGT